MEATRRNLLAGAVAGAVVPVPAVAGSSGADHELIVLCARLQRLGHRCADADLLAACARFHVDYRALQELDSDESPSVTLEEAKERTHRVENRIEDLIPLHAMTDEGRRAKAMVAYLALRLVVNPMLEASLEERLAHSALADLLGKA